MLKRAPALLAVLALVWAMLLGSTVPAAADPGPTDPGLPTAPGAATTTPTSGITLAGDLGCVQPGKSRALKVSVTSKKTRKLRYALVLDHTTVASGSISLKAKKKKSLSLGSRPAGA